MTIENQVCVCVDISMKNHFSRTFKQLMIASCFLTFTRKVMVVVVVVMVMMQQMMKTIR